MSHLKELIDQGFLVDEKTSKIIEDLNDDDFNKLIGSLKKEDFIISEETIRKILLDEVKILKTFEPKKFFTVQDMVKMLNERYDTLKDTLIKKLDLKNLVSINKCSSGMVSIIGMVGSKDEKDENYVISLEDPTGEIQALIPKTLAEKVSLDDVVAVTGNISNKILFVKRLFYPDVPLRPVSYSSNNIKVAFLSENKETDANYIIYKNKVEDKIKNKSFTITNPSLIRIDKIIVLILCGFEPLSILRKRYVNIKNTDFLINIVPDILFIDKEINMNYKGISIIPINKAVNLKTREITDIN